MHEVYMRTDCVTTCSPNVFKYYVYRLLYTRSRAKEAEKPKAKSFRHHCHVSDESEVKIKHVKDYN